MSNILKQIRWQQRYINFEKSFQNLLLATNKSNLNIIENAGLIQFFEITFELGWKTLKDYLDAEGLVINTPREVIKQAFALSILTDGEAWLDALEKRNLMTHTYQEEVANYAVSLIQTKYVHLFSQLIQFLKNKIYPAKNYGFSLGHFISIIQILSLYPEIESVKIFGSRAIGSFKPHSDVDLCLFGNISSDIVSKIKNQLCELSKLPYQFDVVVFNLIKDEAFATHINTVGKSIYAI